MSDCEDDFEEDVEPDQTVTHGYTAPPLPADHWSLSPAWKKAKEGMNDTVTGPAPTEVEKGSWYGHAASLAGCSDEESA